MVPPHMTRNVTQNTRPSSASQGGSGNETRLFNQKSLVGHTIVATVLLVGNATDGTNSLQNDASGLRCAGTLSEQAMVVVLECSNAQP